MLSFFVANSIFNSCFHNQLGSVYSAALMHVIHNGFPLVILMLFSTFPYSLLNHLPVLVLSVTLTLTSLLPLPPMNQRPPLPQEKRWSQVVLANSLTLVRTSQALWLLPPPSRGETLSPNLLSLVSQLSHHLMQQYHPSNNSSLQQRMILTSWLEVEQLMTSELVETCIVQSER